MALLNVARLLQNPRFSQQVDVLRQKVVEDTDGSLVSQYLQTDKISVVTTPTGASDVQMLPEGMRYLPGRKFFSQEVLNIGDLVVYENTHWKIAHLGSWKEYGFYNATGILHEGTQKPSQRAFELR